jgi:hypothetical protein
MTTARQLITSSLRLINVVQQGENPTADDMTTVEYALNTLLDSWSADKLSIYTINPYPFVLIPGQQAYKLGVGTNLLPADWVVPRPMNIEQATVDYQAQMGAQAISIPLQKLSDAEWAAIAVKSTQSTFPMKFFDNGNYPMRTLNFWPVPTTAQTVTLWLWEPLLDYTTLDQPISLPPGYERAIRYNLAVEAAPEFGKTLTSDIINVALSSYANIKILNSTPQIMRCDTGIGNERSSFNWLTGDTI